MIWKELIKFVFFCEFVIRIEIEVYGFFFYLRVLIVGGEFKAILIGKLIRMGSLFTICVLSIFLRENFFFFLWFKLCFFYNFIFILVGNGIFYRYRRYYRMWIRVFIGFLIWSFYF